MAGPIVLDNAGGQIRSGETPLGGGGPPQGFRIGLMVKRDSSSQITVREGRCRSQDNTDEIELTVATPVSVGALAVGTHYVYLAKNTSTSVVSVFIDAGYAVPTSPPANSIYRRIGKVDVAVGSLTTVPLSYTGSDQTFEVPIGVTSIVVKMWGGGAGSAIPEGGAGGYSTGTVTVEPEETLTIKVGGGGGAGSASNAPGGWPNGGNGGNTRGGYYGCGGGGRSALMRGATDIIVAGGGGGGGSWNQGGNYYGGAGGGASGQNGNQHWAYVGGGYGGTTSGESGSGGGGGNGTGGSFHQGGTGNSWNGTGGGDGRYGGSEGTDHGGGGGGSGYIAPTGVTGGNTYVGSTRTPDGTGDADYANSAGYGGAYNSWNNGYSGRVVISYISSPTFGSASDST